MLTSKDVGSTDNNLPSLSRSCGEKTVIQVYDKNVKCTCEYISQTQGVFAQSPEPGTHDKHSPLH